MCSDRMAAPCKTKMMTLHELYRSRPISVNFHLRLKPIWNSISSAQASKQNEAFSRMLLLKLIVHSNIGPPSLLGWKTQHCQLLTCDKSSD